MTSTALKLYTTVVAVLCAAAIAWTINQSTAAAAWRNEALSWQTTVQRTLAREQAVNRRYQRLAVRYNRLVVDTRRSQKRLIAHMQTAQAAPAASVGSSLAAPAPASVAVPAPAAAPSAPTTKTS